MQERPVSNAFSPHHRLSIPVHTFTAAISLNLPKLVSDNGRNKPSNTSEIRPLHPHLRTLPRRASKTDLSTHAKAPSTSNGQGRRDTKVLTVHSNQRLETAHTVHRRLHVRRGRSLVCEQYEAGWWFAWYSSYTGGRLSTISNGRSVLASSCEHCVGCYHYLGWEMVVGHWLGSY